MKREFQNFRVVDGELSIDRGNGFVPQLCPYRGISCGTWCPLFGDVEIVCGPRVDTQYLHICNGVVLESRWMED